jgi:hypothetical protein
MMTTGRFNADFKIALLLIVLTLLVFARVGGHELIFYDDNLYVTENPMVRGGLSWSGLATHALRRPPTGPSPALPHARY